ncbi:MAG: hypothetical protein JST86_00115 [Bacteroidetes bacterium]|nr:hypothetical protein [Bacteroidota bacterium]
MKIIPSVTSSVLGFQLESFKNINIKRQLRKIAWNPANGIVTNREEKKSFAKRVNTNVKMRLNNTKHIKFTGLNKNARESKKAMSPMPRCSFLISVIFLFLKEK